MTIETALMAGAVLLVRVGLALYLSGVCRSKNAAGAALRSVIDLCLVVLSVWAIGASISPYDGNPVFGVIPSFLLSLKVHPWNLLFLMANPLLASGAICGAMAERSRLLAMCGASILVGALLVPVIIQWQQHGWLNQIGYVHTTGSAILACGLCAAVAAAIVGPRTGKYHRDGSSSMIPGHSVPLAVAGAMLMVAGWCCVAGFQAGLEGLLKTLLSASAGMVASLVYANIRFGKPDPMLSLSGFLGASVAALAGGTMLAMPSAVFIGAAAGVLVPWAVVFVDLKLKIDDPSGLVAVNVVGAAWGLLAAEALYSLKDAIRHTGFAALGILAIAALSIGLSWALFAFMRVAFGIRSNEADEYDGLDLAEHEANAYPDFQQTTIKSYHMREA